MQQLLDEPVFIEDNELPPQIEVEEDMPLRKEDWTEIHKVFDAKIEALKPKGWGKFLQWARELGIIGSYVSIIITMAALTLGALYFAFSQVTVVGRFQGDTSRHLEEIDKHLQAIDNTLAGIRLSALKDVPVTRDSSKRVAEVISEAQKNGSKIDPMLVDFTGKKFADASRSDPDAWFATSVILNYKTSLNSEPINAVQISQPFKKVHWHLGIPGSPDWVGEMSFGGGSVTGGLISEIHPIGQPDTWNRSIPNAHYVVMKGGTFNIDGMFLKGVVFMNTKIVYRGDPVRIEHAYFINCTFQMPPAKNTLLFADSILSSNPEITFSGD